MFETRFEVTEVSFFKITRHVPEDREAAFAHSEDSVAFLCWKMIYTNNLVSIIFENIHTGIASFFMFSPSWDFDSELPFKTLNSHLRTHDGCCLQ